MSEVAITVEAVRAAVRTHLGGAPDSVRSLTGFAGQQALLVTARDHDYVVKCGARATTEAWMCERVGRAGIPAPAVVAVDSSRSRLPLPYVVLTRVPGRPVANGDGDAVVEAGQWLRALHDIGAEGYGYLQVSPDGGSRGPCASWREFLTAPLRLLELRVRTGVLDNRLADRLRTAVESHTGLLTGVERPVLLHGDLCPDHVFTADRRVSGIIGWGNALAGDPLFDLGAWANSASPRLLLHGYQPDADPDLQAKVLFYRVAWALLVIVDETAPTRSWFVGHLAGTRNALDRLEAAA